MAHDGLRSRSEPRVPGPVAYSEHIRLRQGNGVRAIEADRARTTQGTVLVQSARMVKAFNTTGWNNMADPVYLDGPIMMFIAGDDAEAKAVVTRLAEDLGFEAVDAGGFDGGPLFGAAGDALDQPGRRPEARQRHRLQADQAVSTPETRGHLLMVVSGGEDCPTDLAMSLLPGSCTGGPPARSR
jgi:hypothetical protein